MVVGARATNYESAKAGGQGRKGGFPAWMVRQLCITRLVTPMHEVSYNSTEGIATESHRHSDGRTMKPQTVVYRASGCGRTENRSGLNYP